MLPTRRANGGFPSPESDLRNFLKELVPDDYVRGMGFSTVVNIGPESLPPWLGCESETFQSANLHRVGHQADRINLRVSYI